MRPYLLLIGLALAATVSYAQKPNTTQKINHTVAQATHPPLVHVTRCLTDRRYCQLLTWQQTQAGITNYEQRAYLRRRQYARYEALRAQLLAEPAPLAYTVAAEQQALQKIAQQKFIFIGESHTHGVQPAILRALQTIRSAHPQKRILLAAETLVTRAPASSPLQPTGTTNPQLVFTDERTALFNTATQLKMDLLSLDDLWTDIQPNAQDKWVYPVKIGNYLIEPTEEDSEVHTLASQRWGKPLSKQDFESPQLLASVYCMALRDYVFSSFWGADQRNQQWARYLTALKNKYDVIIVYAGDGHFRENTIPSLQQRLGLKEYAHVFITKTLNTQEMQQTQLMLQRRGVTHPYVDTATEQIAYKPATSVLNQLPANPTASQVALINTAKMLEQQLGILGVNSLEIEIVLPE